jgi:hypothetical protein
MFRCSQDGVCGIAIATLEEASPEMAFGFHMADDGFDGWAAFEFAFDDAEYPALLAGDEDAPWL